MLLTLWYLSPYQVYLSGFMYAAFYGAQQLTLDIYFSLNVYKIHRNTWTGNEFAQTTVATAQIIYSSDWKILPSRNSYFIIIVQLSLMSSYHN